jgi:hypothetical protein
MLDVDAVAIVQDGADGVRQPPVRLQLRRVRIVVEAADPGPDLLDMLIVAPIRQVPVSAPRTFSLFSDPHERAATLWLLATGDGLVSGRGHLNT